MLCIFSFIDAKIVLHVVRFWSGYLGVNRDLRPWDLVGIMVLVGECVRLFFKGLEVSCDDDDDYNLRLAG